MTLVLTLFIMALIGAMCYPLGKRFGRLVSSQADRDLIRTRRWARLTLLLGNAASVAIIAWAIFDGNMEMLIAIAAILTVVQVAFIWQTLRGSLGQRSLLLWYDTGSLASLIVGIGYLCRWRFSPTGVVAGVIYGIQVTATLVGVVAIFRWAVLYERQKRQRDA